MIDIMHTLHQYVPAKTEDFEDGSRKPAVHKVIFGGDYLTATRGRGCRELRLNSETTVGQLTGLIPVSEDWHTLVTLLSVSTQCNMHSRVTLLSGNLEAPLQHEVIFLI